MEIDLKNYRVKVNLCSDDEVKDLIKTGNDGNNTADYRYVMIGNLGVKIGNDSYLIHDGTNILETLFYKPSEAIMEKYITKEYKKELKNKLIEEEFQLYLKLRKKYRFYKRKK
jgi:hypothetical protein